MICHLAASGILSHSSTGDEHSLMSGNGWPSSVIAAGHRYPFACTQKPTKPAMATRPCLISACRRKPMVASFGSLQKVWSASWSGSQ